jgi:hypothetical protein
MFNVPTIAAANVIGSSCDRAAIGRRMAHARLLVQWRVGAARRPDRHEPSPMPIETGERTMTQSRGSFFVRGATAVALTAALSLAACSSTAPVEFSLSGADAPSLTRADDLDFGPMDNSIAACKTVSHNAGAGRCAQVRAYESCMKTRGYITVLGPENPSGCGDPEWEQDVRKWLK